MNLGHFPAGDRVRASLVSSKAAGLSFNRAWNIAMQDAHLRRNGHSLSERAQEDAEAIRFARQAFRRAYEGEPPIRQDQIARGLLHALEHMLDESEEAERRALEDLMEEAA